MDGTHSTGCKRKGQAAVIAVKRPAKAPVRAKSGERPRFKDGGYLVTLVQRKLAAIERLQAQLDAVLATMLDAPKRRKGILPGGQT